MRLLSLVIVLMLTTSPVFALVDARNANFSDAWQDIDIPGSGFALKVTRAYNSRSLFNGIFGFGWCSDLETSLDVTAEGTIKILECGDGADIVFRARDFSKEDVAETADKIIAALKKEQPGMQPAAIAKLKTELAQDRNLREQLAEKHKITSSAKDGTKYFANGRENEVIIKDKAGYTRTLTDGTLQKYDLEGRLIYNYDKNGNFLKYSYQNNLVREAIDNQGRKMTFEYYPSKKVKSITAPNKVSASYKYKGLNDLEWVKTGQGNVYTYEYDDLHNLTQITLPDKTTKKLTYDKNKDWITSFTDREGCVEKYNWVLSKEDPKNNYFSTLEKSCAGKLVNKSKFEFWFKARPDGDGKYLARTVNTVNELTTDTTYHPKFGKPTSVTQGGLKTTYEYFDNGLVQSRTVGKIVTKFRYDDDTKKVIEVKTGDKTTSFKYDKSGNLINAQSSEGLIVTLAYDDKGRITSITDQAKRKVNIAYEEKFGKPKMVERPGVGAIEVQYKPNGEIKDVKSKQGGPTVAVQVASTFNSLLELVAPAGVDLGL